MVTDTRSSSAEAGFYGAYGDFSRFSGLFVAEPLHIDERYQKPLLRRQRQYCPLNFGNKLTSAESLPPDC